MSKAEAEAVAALMDGILDGTWTTREVSDTLQISLELIERVAARLTEQRLGLPPSSPDDLLNHFAKRFFLVMRRPWD